MRKIYFLVLIFLLTITSVSISKPLGKWAYILHSSKLSKEYIKKIVSEYNIISITGFKIYSNGEVNYKLNDLTKSIIIYSKKNSINIYPLISFQSSSVGHKILNSNKLTQKLIINIFNLIHTHNFPGIHIDFEYLPPDDSKKLLEFLKLLRAKIPSCLITMAIFPQIDFPIKWSRFHNIQLISKYLDEIVLMCYDYHRPGTKPGPVTDLEWTEKNIKETLKYMTSKKIWLGIPAYGYSWSKDNKTTVISARYAVKLAQKNKSIRHSSGNLFITYTKSKKQFNAYVSDKKTRGLLKKIALKFNLAGTAIWRIGLED